MTFNRISGVAGLVLAAFLLSPVPAHASGFYLQEQSVSGMGAAFAGQGAMARDASILFFNPSGISNLDSAQFNIGVQAISPHVKLEDQGTHLNSPGTAFSFAPGQDGIGGGDGGNPTGTSLVPSAYIAAPIGGDKNLWAGFGISSPFGLSSKYDQDFFGAFDSTESKLKTFDLQPTLSWNATGWLSVGASFIAEYAAADLTSTALLPVANGAPPPAYFVVEREQRLKGKDWGYGGNIGVTLKPQPGTTVGLDYRSQIHHKLDGTIAVAGQFDEAATAKLDLPAMASVSLAQKVWDRWTGLASVSWTNWSSFDTIAPQRKDGVALPDDPQNYKDSWAFSIGDEYEISPDWTLRAGYQHDQTPTRDAFRTTRIPDGNRDWLALGATYKWSRQLSLDAGAAYIHVGDGSIDRERGAGADIAEVQAKTSDAHIGIVSLALNYKF